MKSSLFTISFVLALSSSLAFSPAFPSTATRPSFGLQAVKDKKKEEAEVKPERLYPRPEIAAGKMADFKKVVRNLSKENFDEIYKWEETLKVELGGMAYKKAMLRITRKAKESGVTLKAGFADGAVAKMKAKAQQQVYIGAAAEAKAAADQEAADAKAAEAAAAAEAAEAAAAAEVAATEAAAAAAAEAAAAPPAEEPAAEEPAAVAAE